ncbi:MAG: hypothetical protein CSA74_04985 [Rhodobacterales bacterium]|nr:MAG: hypothetical protein CSA74_04985 [Rhodobacterales bacterium]
MEGDQPNGSHHHPPGGLRVADAGLSPTEQNVLTIARHFMQSLARPESQGWIRAFGVAHAVWPKRLAPGLGVAVFAMVQCLRGARVSGFRFSNPDCEHCSAFLSDDERRLANMLKATSRGARSAAHADALMLCEGNDPAMLLEAVRGLADLIQDALRDAEEGLHAEHRAMRPAG